MAEFKVNTVQLDAVADQLQSLQWDMDNIQQRLSKVQLGTVLQMRGSWGLQSRLADCLVAVGNHENNLKKLSNRLDWISELYKDCEKGLTEPKTEKTAAKEKTNDTFDSILDKIGGLNLPLGLVSIVWNFCQGSASDTVDGLKGLAKAIGSGTKAIFNIETGGVKTDWWKGLLGIDSVETKSFGDALGSSLDDFFPGGNATVAAKVSSAAEWAGAILSFVGSGISNYDEFDGEMNGRFWAETITEGVIDIGKDILISAGVVAGAAALGVTSLPAIAVAGISVAVAWAADGVCEWITGKSVTELVSDAVLDVGERVVEGVSKGVEKVVDGAKKIGKDIAEGAKNIGKSIADGASAAWNSIVESGSRLFSW